MPIEFGYLLDIVILSIVYLLISESWKHVSKGKKILYTMMYIYVSFILFFTLMPIVSALPHVREHEYVAMNMFPFVDYIMERKYAKQEIIMNIIMFIPFGIMLPLLKNKKFIYVFFQALIFTLAIELLQPLLHVNRVADITDVLTNLFGGIVGYFIFLVFNPIFKRCKFNRA